MPRAKGIIRIDSDSTHGWQVRVYRHGRTYSRLFSDRKCGGEEESFQQALAYRDTLKEEVAALPEAAPRRRLIRGNKNNSTGVLGVSRTYKRDRRGNRHEVYAVSWNPAPGQARGTSFSVKKYGEETAFLMACRLRFQKMKGVYGERYPYTSPQELFAEGAEHLAALRAGAAPETSTSAKEAQTPPRRLHMQPDAASQQPYAA